MSFKWFVIGAFLSPIVLTSFDIIVYLAGIVSLLWIGHLFLDVQSEEE